MRRGVTSGHPRLSPAPLGLPHICRSRLSLRLSPASLQSHLPALSPWPSRMSSHVPWSCPVSTSFCPGTLHVTPSAPGPPLCSPGILPVSPLGVPPHATPALCPGAPVPLLSLCWPQGSCAQITLSYPLAESFQDLAPVSPPWDLSPCIIPLLLSVSPWASCPPVSSLNLSLHVLPLCHPHPLTADPVPFLYLHVNSVSLGGEKVTTGTTHNLPYVGQGDTGHRGDRGTHQRPHLCYGGVLITELWRMVAPQAGSGGWVLSLGQFLGAEGWVGWWGRGGSGPAACSGGGRWLRAEVLFVVLVALPMETGLVQAPSSLPAPPGTPRVLGMLCPRRARSPPSCPPATMAKPWWSPPPRHLPPR